MNLVDQALFYICCGAKVADGFDDLLPALLRRLSSGMSFRIDGEIRSKDGINAVVFVA